MAFRLAEWAAKGGDRPRSSPNIRRAEGWRDSVFSGPTRSCTGTEERIGRRDQQLMQAGANHLLLHPLVDDPGRYRHVVGEVVGPMTSHPFHSIPFHSIPFPKRWAGRTLWAESGLGQGPTTSIRHSNGTRIRTSERTVPPVR